MPPVSRRTNFTDRKAPGFSSCAADCRSNRSCSAARMKISDDPEPKTSPRLRAWRQPRTWAMRRSRAGTEIARASCANALWERSRSVPGGPAERRDRRPAGEHAECQFPRHRFGDDADGARFGRRLRVERLGLHGRFGRASHVLLAMGLPMERARSAVRFSLGKQTDAEEIDRAAEAIVEIVDRLAKTKRKSDAYAVA